MLLPSPDWRRFHQLWMTSATLILGENSDSAGWLLAPRSFSIGPALSAAPGNGYEGVAWKQHPNNLFGPNYVEHMWFLSCGMKETCVGQWNTETRLLVSACVNVFVEKWRKGSTGKIRLYSLRWRSVDANVWLQPTSDSYWCLLPSFTHL